MVKKIVLLGVWFIVCASARVGFSAGSPIAGSGGGNGASACLADAKLELTADPPLVTLGQSTRLSWSVTLPDACTMVHFQLNREAVARKGSEAVTPMRNTTFTLAASESNPGQSVRKTAVARVTVVYPMRIVRTRGAVALVNRFAAPVKSTHPA